jgi:uncharacterized cupin superfamily protein
MAPTPNIFEPEFDDAKDREGFSYKRSRIGRQAGGQKLGASVYEIEPGSAPFPYHWHEANEEMLVVLSGRPTLRTPAGNRGLGPGDVVIFATGEEGAHQVVNDTGEPVRVLMISTMIAPEVGFYPDSGKRGVMVRAPGAAGADDQSFWREEDTVDYWDGESPPTSMTDSV